MTPLLRAIMLMAAGEAPYVANAVLFDGTNDYMLRGSDLSSTSDGTSGILSFWCRIDGGDGTNRSFLENLASIVSFDIRITSGNTFRIHGNTSAPVNILYLISNSTYVASSAWRHVLASWDLSGATPTHLYINDASDKNTAVATNGTLDYNTAGPNWSVGSGTDGSRKFNGALAEFYFAPNQYLDFSIEANRRKFIRASGKPENLGADGSVPTGTAPKIYLANPFGTFQNNLGSGGNFSVTGALSAASTSPSD